LGTEDPARKGENGLGVNKKKVIHEPTWEKNQPAEVRLEIQKKMQYVQKNRADFDVVKLKNAGETGSKTHKKKTKTGQESASRGTEHQKLTRPSLATWKAKKRVKSVQSRSRISKKESAAE